MFYNNAAKYAEMGWQVFPLLPKGKTPITENGVDNSTTARDQIRQWGNSYPNANIGIATGKKSGFFVVDIDGSGGETDLQWLQDKFGMLPETLTVATSGGKHLYFKYPQNAEVGNRAKLKRHKNDGVKGGIDVRGDGGYVVAPPSIHPSGTVYQWANDTAIADCPDWLLGIILKTIDVNAKDAVDLEYPDGIEEIEIPTITPRSSSTAKGNDFQRFLDKQCETVRGTGEGARNDTLNIAAYNVGGLMIALNGSRSLAEQQLLAAALAVGLPDEEAIKTIKSGLDSGLKKPMTPKPPAYTSNGNAAALPALAMDTGEVTALAAAGVAIIESFLTELPLTEWGNGEAFAMLYSEKAKYDATAKCWRIWDGERWRRDNRHEAERLMIAATRKRRDAFHAMPTSDDEQAKRKKRGWDFALKCENYVSAKNSLNSAAMNALLVSETNEYDKLKYVACAGHYTLNLNDCEAYQSQREDMQTLKLGATFDPAAECPRWRRFISEIFPNDEELQHYIRRVAGYCLTGETKEQCFFILHGNGSNGKSTFLNVLAWVLGEYHTSTPFRTFAESRNDSNEAMYALAQCRASRLLTMSETNEGIRLNEGLAKLVTGGDEIAAREMRAMPFRYRPQFKLMLALNHLPRITGTDDGIWRRVHLLPFLENFQGRKDPTLEATLYSEVNGILNWMLEGLVDWLKQGLNPPAIVKATTQKYREESDLFGRWFDETINKTNNDLDYLASGAIYSAYVRWATSAGIKHPLALNQWGQRMDAIGVKKLRKASGYFYQGIQFNSTE